MSAVPPFKQYYPSQSDMNSPQKQFYESWLNAWQKGQPIGVEGQVSYLFCYVYSILGKIVDLSPGTIQLNEGVTLEIPSRKIKSKGIEEALSELVNIKDAFSNEEGFFMTCCHWISDCFVILERYHEAIAARPVISPDSRSMWATNYLLSLKLIVGSNITGRDVLTLCGPRVTTFGKKHLSEIMQYIDTILKTRERETERNMLTEWVNDSSQHPYYVFSGTHFASPTHITAYDFSRNEKVANFTGELIREAENTVREKAGLSKVRVTTKKRPKKVAPPPVSLGIKAKEELPYPVVYYPNHYGAFFGFAEDESSTVVLCACSETAIRNYLCLRTMLPEGSYSNPLRGAPLSSILFPDIIAEASTRHSQAPLSVIRFEERLCHRCNLVKPTLRYCHEMYGEHFVQYYGWYIKQAYLRLGIYPQGHQVEPVSLKAVGYPYIPDVCLDEYKVDIVALREAQNEYNVEMEKIMNMVHGSDRADIRRDEVTYFHNVTSEDAREMIRLRRKAAKLTRAFTTKIENIVRQEFGFRKVGEGWVSETMLFQILQRILPEQEVIRHYHPDWLDGLELDIYFPTLQLALEYQGQQHFHSIKAWGGEKALGELRNRDKRKEEICKRLGVCLITIDYTESLTEEHIRKMVDAKKPGLLA